MNLLRDKKNFFPSFIWLLVSSKIKQVIIVIALVNYQNIKKFEIYFIMLYIAVFMF